MSDTKRPVTAHVARMAMNNDPEVRAWVEEWLKARLRKSYVAPEGAGEEEFEKHWRYVKPETMHEGAVEGYEAYLARGD
jgi:hypothetical protein